MRLIVAKRILLGLGAIATAVILFRSGGYNLSLGFLALSLGFLVWCLSPLALLWIFGRTDDPLSVRLLLLAAAAIVTGAGVDAYVDAMFVHLDPQSGLVFVLVPAVQLAMVAIAMIIAGLMRWRFGMRPPRGNGDTSTIHWRQGFLRMALCLGSILVILGLALIDDGRLANSLDRFMSADETLALSMDALVTIIWAASIFWVVQGFRKAKLHKTSGG